ncbi:MAG: hypothetical protein O7G30_16090, partial [Proteobacteria bacterium]|nr:hypothetical protein [Pseudomonadota bacterium]
LQLRRPRTRQGYTSCDLLAWVRDWLPRLLDANQRVQLYPEPYFSRAVGECWYRFWRWDVKTGSIGGVRLLDPAVRNATLRYLTGEWILHLRYGNGVV